MTIQPLRNALHAKPFQAFRLQLGDGTQVAITHPECIAFHPRSPRTLLVALPDGGFKAVDLLLVAALHVGNGRKRRKK